MTHLFPRQVKNGVYDLSRTCPKDFVRPRESVWNHIFVNHGYNSNDENKTRFPEEWTEEYIKYAVMESVTNPDYTELKGENRKFCYKKVGNQLLRVWLQKRRNTCGRFMVNRVHPVTEQQKEIIWGQIESMKKHTSS